MLLEVLLVVSHPEKRVLTSWLYGHCNDAEDPHFILTYNQEIAVLHT